MCPFGPFIHIAFKPFAAIFILFNGYSPKKVSKWAGHATITITLDTYGHLWKDPENDQGVLAEIIKEIRECRRREPET